MKRLTIILATILLLATCVGCRYNPTKVPSPPPSEVEPTTPANTEGGTATLPPTGGEEPPEDMNWISPGKVNIGNYVFHCPDCGEKIVSDIPLILATCPVCGETWETSLSDWEDKRFHPGARAEWYISVHNGNDETTVFSVTYKVPDRIARGYIAAPTIVEDWVMITDPTPVIAPKETRNILIVLEMPSDAPYIAPKWEFWIAVKDLTQTGFVQTELCSRSLISMRE